MKEYPTIEPMLFELLELSKANYLKLLKEERPNDKELASCQLSVQYYLSEIAQIKKAQRPKASLVSFFKSIVMRLHTAKTQAA